MTNIAFLAPDLGENKDSNIIEICKKVNDSIQEGETFLVVETAKATVDMPSKIAGIITAIYVKVGDVINTGDKLADINISVDVDSSKKEEEKPQNLTSSNQQGVLKTENNIIANSEQNNKIVKVPQGSNEIFASPAVRRLAHEENIDLLKIVPTGLKNRITIDDIKQYLLVNNSKNLNVANNINVAKDSNGTDDINAKIETFKRYGTVRVEELSRIKKISGEHLTKCYQEIPHVTQFDKANITNIESYRKELNQEFANNPKITILAFLIKAVVIALKKYPEFNSSLINDSLCYKEYYNIGFATNTKDGLLVPVIKNVSFGILTIAEELTRLSNLAREKKLAPLDMQGATFTISSLGGIGGTGFTPIINSPEVAILGVSKASIEPIWQESSKTFMPSLILPLSLSYDHRVIDGALAAAFTNYLGYLLNDPRKLIL